MNALTLPPRVEAQALRALRKQGLSQLRATIALAKWKANARPERCVEEQRGKEIGLHTGCLCVGCQERLALMYFATVAALCRRDMLT